MNMIKKNGGFTLVELIVVIAILAILAAVAVPVYSGYISKANETADQQKLEAVETAMSAALAMNGEDASDADDYFALTLNENTGNLTIAKKSYDADAPANLDKVWSDFGEFYGSTTSVNLQYYSDADDVPSLLGCVVVDSN